MFGSSSPVEVVFTRRAAVFLLRRWLGVASSEEEASVLLGGRSHSPCPDSGAQSGPPPGGGHGHAAEGAVWGDDQHGEIEGAFPINTESWGTEHEEAGRIEHERTVTPEWGEPAADWNSPSPEEEAWQQHERPGPTV